MRIYSQSSHLYGIFREVLHAIISDVNGHTAEQKTEQKFYFKIFAYH